jgi:hypothetical protein
VDSDHQVAGSYPAGRAIANETCCGRARLRPCASATGVRCTAADSPWTSILAEIAWKTFARSRSGAAAHSYGRFRKSDRASSAVRDAPVPLGDHLIFSFQVGDYPGELRETEFAGGERLSRLMATLRNASPIRRIRSWLIDALIDRHGAVRALQKSHALWNRVTDRRPPGEQPRSRRGTPGRRVPADGRAEDGPSRRNRSKSRLWARRPGGRELFSGSVAFGRSMEL